MDDKTLEKKLKEAFEADLPEGMRERVLGKAQREIPVKRGFFTWRVALSTAAVLVIITCNVLDNRWTGASQSAPTTAQVYRALEARRELARALGDMSVTDGGQYR